MAIKYNLIIDKYSAIFKSNKHKQILHAIITVTNIGYEITVRIGSYRSKMGTQILKYANILLQF
jgi:hypothetical protein